MELLLEGEALSELKRMLASDEPALMAIAYWGRNAVKNLGLSHRTPKNLKVVCDLFSGCCNPAEMTKLLKVADVRTLDMFHAKLTVVGYQILLGSSNASTNGLGEEDIKAGRVEANALLEDPAFAAKAQQWFDEIWLRATCVDPNLIRQSKITWDLRQSGKPVRGSLIAAVAATPETFDDVYVLSYRDSDISEEAEAAFESRASEEYSATERKGHEVWTAPYYEDWLGWDPPAGRLYLDFSSSSGKRLKYNEIWQVRKRVPFGKHNPERALVLCDWQPGVHGVRVTDADVDTLKKILKHRIDWRKIGTSEGHPEIPLRDLLNKS